MSANRRTTGSIPGDDCPEEMTFREFLSRCEHRPAVRVQGRAEAPTMRRGRLVRFNRAVFVNVKSARVTKRGEPVVDAVRLEWDRANLEWRRTNKHVTLAWRLLDWCTWQLGGDPNGTWAKITTPTLGGDDER